MNRMFWLIVGVLFIIFTVLNVASWKLIPCEWNNPYQ